MAYTVTTLKADGTVTRHEYFSEAAVNNMGKKGAIKTGLGGAWLELVPHFDQYGDKPCVAFCDEESKLKGLPLNAKATYLWMACLAPEPFIPDTLHGPIVVVTADDPADLQKL